MVLDNIPTDYCQLSEYLHVNISAGNNTNVDVDGIFYSFSVATIVLCCIGSLWNVLILIILSQNKLRFRTTNAYLMALAIADLSVLIASFLTTLKDSRKPEPGYPIWCLWRDQPWILQAYPYAHATAILFQVKASHCCFFVSIAVPFRVGSIVQIIT